MAIDPSLVTNPTDPTDLSHIASAGHEPSHRELEKSLSYFRSNMLKYFPILHLPEDTQSLHRERPFLCLCIRAITCQPLHQRLALHEKIQQSLARDIILENNPNAANIDVLLGLLTFLAWGHDHLFHKNPNSLSRFTQLAMMVVFELRLNKPLPNDSNMLPVGDYNGGRRVATGPARSLEERRALLGCFLMSSMLADPLLPLYLSKQLMMLPESRRISHRLILCNGRHTWRSA